MIVRSVRRLSHRGAGSGMVAGVVAFRIEIAECGLRFDSDERGEDLLRQRFSLFEVARESDSDTTIYVEWDPEGNHSAATPVSLSEKGAAFEMGIGSYRASVAKDGRAATVHAPYTLAHVEIAMRLALSLRLLQRRALLVHASAVKVDGAAWIFVGASGVGKSTIARELDSEIVCDETVALIPSVGRVQVHSTPYWISEPARAELAGIVFPKRGPEPLWTPLSAGRAAALLFSQAGPLPTSLTQDGLAAASRIAESISAATATLPEIRHIRSWLQPQLRSSQGLEVS